MAQKLKKIAILIGLGYAALLLLNLAYIKVFGQTPAQSLTMTVYANITSASRLDGCMANMPCIDNRSQFIRQSSTSSYRAYGTGTWSVDMQYADGAPSGWVSFGSTAQVDQVSPSSGIGFGIGPGSIQKPYHDYIRFVITGNATIMNYTGTRQLWWLPAVAAIAFPLTANQGGTSGLFYADALSGSLSGGCAAAHTAGLTLLVANQWTGITTQALNCNVQIFSGGKIQPASGQTVTLSQNAICPPAQPSCYDESAGGTIAFAGPTSFTPTNWGGDPTGVALSTAPFLACIRVASLTGGTCSVAGMYRIHNLTYTVGLTSKNFSIAGCSVGCGFIDTTKDGADSLTIDWTTTTRARVSITDLDYTGPDATHAGAGSGHGIVITSSTDTQPPLVYISGLHGIHYYGAGKSPFYCHFCEDSQFDWSEFSDSDRGFFGDESFNGNTLNSIRSHTTYTEGLYCPSCQNDTFNSVLAESTVGRGIYISGAANTLNAPHAELNNTGATSGLCTVEFHASTDAGFAGATVGNVINAPIFQGTHEKLCFTNDGTSVSIANVIVGGVSSGLSGGIFLDGFSSTQVFISYTTLAQITGATATTVILGEQVSGISYFADGTSANPGIAFTADPTTGISRVTAGGQTGLRFSSVGVSMGGVTTSGNVTVATRYLNPLTGAIPTFDAVVAQTGACGSATAGEGTQIYVHDGNGATVGSTLSAGGSTHQEYAGCDGANWIVTALVP